MFKITRSIVDIVVAGVLSLHRRLKVIAPHAGAASPVLTDRIGMAPPALAPPGAPAPRSAFASFSRHETRWNDADVYGHLNNAVHYTLFDSAVNGWLIRRGLLSPSTGERIGLVVETGCRYHAELRFPDVVTVGLRVVRIGVSSVRYAIALFREDEDAAAAEGFFVHVYVDARTRRPAPMEESLRAALATLMVDGAQEAAR